MPRASLSPHGSWCVALFVLSILVLGGRVSAADQDLDCLPDAMPESGLERGHGDCRTQEANSAAESLKKAHARVLRYLEEDLAVEGPWELSEVKYYILAGVGKWRFLFVKKPEHVPGNIPLGKEFLTITLRGDKVESAFYSIAGKRDVWFNVHLD